MPELRKDPIIGRWVIISSERGRRPSSFSSVAPRSESATMCPFCPGNEGETPPEVLAFRKNNSEPNQPGWDLRVISNKYPALVVEGDMTREPKGMYDSMDGIGAHEVIIETPFHACDIVDMSAREVRDILWAYRERMTDLERDIRFKYILVFKNHGEAAGASLEHAHSQLIAMPIVPKRIAEKIEGAARYYSFKERCVFCDIVRQEISDDERIIRDYDSFIAFEPYASRFPFETCIIPKSHQSSFLETSEGDFTILAECLKDVLTRLNLALNNPPYNYMLCTRPTSSECRDYFHWHLEIIPKLTKVAGFEWGSGFYINPTRPEDAADFLRKVQVSEYRPAPRPTEA